MHRRSQMGVLVIAVAVLALGAGVAGGLLAAKLPAAAGRASLGPGAPLTEALSLSTQQREQMRGIWEAVRAEVRDTFDQARALERRRDEAYIALLTEEQKARYEKISQELAIEFDALAHRRDQLFEKAVAETRKLLDATQKAKYDEILRTRGPAGMEGPRGDGRGAGSGIGLKNPAIDGRIRAAEPS